MTDCCTNASCEIEKLEARQRGTLITVLAINAVMFVVELGAGLLVHSTALIADSLDMLGDASVYAFSLFVVARGVTWKARAALAKGVVMGAFGVLVLAEAAYKIVFPVVPHAETIGVVGALALAANAVCLLLLTRHRREDINMRSVWLCSRNDIIANVAVLGAAGGVWAWQSQLPDVLVGVAIALLFLRSATGVTADARRELAAARIATPVRLSVAPFTPTTENSGTR